MSTNLAVRELSFYQSHGISQDGFSFKPFKCGFVSRF